MTKSEYINALEKNLKYKLPEAELKDIISDMNECFEAGIAEGKTESQIINKLGFPDKAAEAIIGERRDTLNIPKVLLKEYCLPVVLSLLICGSFAIIASDVQEILIFSFIIPLLMWLVLEQKNFIRGLTERKADGFMLAASMILISAITVFAGLPLSLKGIDSGIFIKIPIINVFMFGYTILLIISLLKNTKKVLCIIPISIAAASAVNNVSLLSLTAEISKLDVFNTYIYKYYARYIYIFTAAVIFTLILNSVKKNSFTIPVFFLMLFSALCVIDWYQYLTRFDPANITRGNLNGGMPYLIYGIVSCIITTISIIILKSCLKRKAGVN